MKDFSGNSRFLYLKNTCDSIDISKALSVIDKEIIDSKKLNFVSSNIILEFFNTPKENSFLESSVNIGRSITGFEQQVFDKLNYKDYSNQSSTSIAVKMGDSWDDFFQNAKDLIPNGIDKWSLIITEDFSEVTISFFTV